MPKLKTLTEIYSIGLSQTLRAGSSSISLGIANNIAASFGVIPLAVLGVADRIQMVVFSVFGGISQGMLPLVGYNFGAQKKERVGEILVKAVLISSMSVINSKNTVYLFLHIFQRNQFLFFYDFMNGYMGNILPLEDDSARIRFNQPGNEVKKSRLTSAIGSY
jgi:Na+-driven multidrug efflux pump